MRFKKDSCDSELAELCQRRWAFWRKPVKNCWLRKAGRAARRTLLVGAMLKMRQRRYNQGLAGGYSEWWSSDQKGGRLSKSETRRLSDAECGGTDPCNYSPPLLRAPEQLY